MQPNEYAVCFVGRNPVYIFLFCLVLKEKNSFISHIGYHLAVINAYLPPKCKLICCLKWPFFLNIYHLPQNWLLYQELHGKSLFTFSY